MDFWAVGFGEEIVYLRVSACAAGELGDVHVSQCPHGLENSTINLVAE